MMKRDREIIYMMFYYIISHLSRGAHMYKKLPNSSDDILTRLKEWRDEE